MSTNDIEITTLKGQQILPYVDDLAHLRIQVFREYPYLYEGSMTYEQGYLKRFIDNPGCVMVIVRDKKTQQIVGASTAALLASEMDEVKNPFLQKNFKLEELFYFSESVLLPAYRGHGIGTQFFTEREKAAKAYPQIKYITFCAVDRDPAQRPKEYHPLDEFWQTQGFKKHPDLFTQFEWLEIGAAEKTWKKMTFWIKTL